MKKKVISGLLCLLVVAFAVIPCYADNQGIEPRVMGIATVSGDGVNVRTGPSTSYPSLGMMNKGDKVGVQYLVPDEDSSDPDDMWAYCVCGEPNPGLRGYISIDYLTDLVED